MNDIKKGFRTKSIYKTDLAKTEVLKLYDNQLAQLGQQFQDIQIDTSFGKTHLIETGNVNGPALLVFHGGNSTTAYNLLMCKYLLSDFHIFAVDTIGHPGKSAQSSLSARGYSYGQWASEVISGLGFDQIRCLGGSFGGGILAKLMCVAPQKILKSVLIVPSAINNALPIGSAKMMIPLIQYAFTHNDKYIKRTAQYMSITEDVLDENTLATIKNSFDYVKTKVVMPSNVSKTKMQKYDSPTLVIASELDCLFPAKLVLKRAKEIIANCTTYELKGRGHMHILTAQEQNMIVQFLK